MIDMAKLPVLSKSGSTFHISVSVHSVVPIVEYQETNAHGKGSCYDEWNKNGVPVQHKAHGNLVGQDHVERKHNHVLQGHAAKNQQPEYSHETASNWWVHDLIGQGM